MYNSIVKIPEPYNEPVLSYKPGSAERELLDVTLKEMASQRIDIPIIIGGKEIKTGNTGKCICPHKREHVLATYQKAGKKEVELAIKTAMAAKKQWAEIRWERRAAIMLKAAELISTKYRYILNASTMLNQSKNAFQAEIDATAELADFFRFNAYYLKQIYEEQPMFNPPGIWNRLQWRPLEGFVFAVTPFNFTSISGNLPSSAALMGNVVIWKPASTSVYSGYYLMKLFEEAGFPAGVINFLPGSGAEVGDPVLESEDLAGIHFTGSTAVFQSMWKKIGENISHYKTYPRIVGETGGKDFIFVHESADPQAVATGAVRGAFEYQGQKCSAASRMYLPSSMKDDIFQRMLKQLKEIKTGDIADYTNFMNAVIDEASFDKCMGFIERAKASSECEIIFGGSGDKSKGFFIEPTVILTTNPQYETMEEELFAPVLTVYAYEDSKYEETLDICDSTSPYALTGAIFARDAYAIETAEAKLMNSAGNFYINDKPTGAVVGQQPFGGARGSGTNDKAGSYLNLLRWVSARTVKEAFCPPHDFKYPFMG